MIVKELVEDLLSRELPKVVEIRVGLFYTGVLLEDGRAGIASTLKEITTPRRDHFDLKSLGTEKLLEGLISPDPLLSTIGMATLNALTPTPQEYQKGDILDFLELLPSDRVALVGYFEPLTRRLKDRVKELYVLERDVKVEGLFPDWAAFEILPKSDVVIITGTTLINKTIDNLLEFTKGAKKVALLGPSTPMTRRLLRWVDIASGIRILDPKAVMDIISQGGGTKAILSVAEKVNLLK